MNLKTMRVSETTEQIKLFLWADQNKKFIPELNLLFHIPNEGKRSKASGQILKAEGLKAGMPDICLPVSRHGYHALYIEMKFGKNKPTAAQRKMIDTLQAEGNKAVVSYSAAEAREVIREYLQRGEGFHLSLCENALKVFDRCEGINQEKAPCTNCKFYIRKGE